MLGISTRDIWLSTDRGRLYTRRWHPASGAAKDGPAIVLFHDSLGCVELWRDFPERLALATGRDVVAYDRLGFGRSDPHPGKLQRGFVVDEARSAFRTVREQWQLDSFVAFGHSVGGGMAIACAAEYPDRCHALITESAQAFVEDRTLAGIRAAKHAFAQPAQFDRLRRYHGDKAAWVLDAWTETWLGADFAGWNLDAELRGVRCPALVLHGDGDEYGSTRQPRHIAELVGAHSTLCILPGCSHVPHREHGERIVDTVAQWLAALPDLDRTS